MLDVKQKDSQLCATAGYRPERPGTPLPASAAVPYQRCVHRRRRASESVKESRKAIACRHPTSADHSVTASDLVKDFTKVFTEPAEPRGPLNYAYGLLLKTGLITIVCSLLFLHRERQHNIEKQMVKLFFSFLLITDIMHSVHLAL